MPIITLQYSMKNNKLNFILAIPGSLRKGSSNHAILNHLATLVPANINYNIYEDLAQIPPFNPGLDNDQPPVPVIQLRDLLTNANGVVICTPEYAFGVPGQLKNMLDWMVSSSSFVDKPLCLITASSSGEHAHASLLLTLGALSAKVTEDTALRIPFIRAKVRADGLVTDEETRKDISYTFGCFLKMLGHP